MRERFLRFAADADLPRARARMIELAGTLGWLSPADQRAELVRMVGELIGRGSIGPPRSTSCARSTRTTGSTRSASRLQPSPAQADKVNNAAALACLGERDRTHSRPEGAHQPVRRGRRVGPGLPGSPADHRCRGTAFRRDRDRAHARIGRPGSRSRNACPASAERQPELERARAPLSSAASVDVQRAIAAVLIRADYESIAKPEFVRVLSQNRRNRRTAPTSSTSSSVASGRSHLEGATVESAIKILGIVLIAGGILGLVYGGFSYTKESHEAKIGPITLSVTEKGSGQCPDVGRDRRAIVVGGLILVFGSRKG